MNSKQFVKQPFATAGEFVDRHRPIRLVLLSAVLLWNTMVVVGGVYKALFIDGGLTAQDVAFFGTITAMANIPMGFYYWRRMT